MNSTNTTDIYPPDVPEPVPDNTNLRLLWIFGSPIVGGAFLGYVIGKTFTLNLRKSISVGIALGVSIDCLLMAGVIYALKNLT